jgi:hypothetical protein
MTAQEEFWNWFIRNEPDLFDLDPSQVAEQERIFDELATELQKVDPDLTFEFGPNEPTREFVISAGIKRVFPAVVAPASAGHRSSQHTSQLPSRASLRPADDVSKFPKFLSVLPVLRQRRHFVVPIDVQVIFVLGSSRARIARPSSTRRCPNIPPSRDYFHGSLWFAEP